MRAIGPWVEDWTSSISVYHAVQRVLRDDSQARMLALVFFGLRTCSGLIDVV